MKKLCGAKIAHGSIMDIARVSTTMCYQTGFAAEDTLKLNSKKMKKDTNGD